MLSFFFYISLNKPRENNLIKRKLNVIFREKKMGENQLELGSGAKPIGFVTHPNCSEVTCEMSGTDAKIKGTNKMERHANWESKVEERTEEICRALVRMEEMTHAQIARLLRVSIATAMRIVLKQYELFDYQRIQNKKVKQGRYAIPNRPKQYVKLTEEAFEEWAKKEGVHRKRRYIRSESQGPTFEAVEIMIKMHHAGMLYDEWDMSLPQDDVDGVHAQIMKRASGEAVFKLDVFIMPLRLNHADERMKGPVFSSTIHRITEGAMQRIVSKRGDTPNVLLLIPKKYYSTALKVLTRNGHKYVQFYLLPLESFKADPKSFLTAIYTNSGEQRELMRLLYQDRPRMPLPIEYDSLDSLVEVSPGTWRFVDVWASGDVKKVIDWYGIKQDYQVPNEAAVARAIVYVNDETMRNALNAVMNYHKRDHERDMVTSQPWPMEHRESVYDEYDEFEDVDELEDW